MRPYVHQLSKDRFEVRVGIVVWECSGDYRQLTERQREEITAAMMASHLEIVHALEDCAEVYGVQPHGD